MTIIPKFQQLQTKFIPEVKHEPFTVIFYHALLGSMPKKSVVDVKRVENVPGVFLLQTNTDKTVAWYELLPFVQGEGVRINTFAYQEQLPEEFAQLVSSLLEMTLLTIEMNKIQERGAVEGPEVVDKYPLTGKNWSKYYDSQTPKYVKDAQFYNNIYDLVRQEFTGETIAVMLPTDNQEVSLYTDARTIDKIIAKGLDDAYPFMPPQWATEDT